MKTPEQKMQELQKAADPLLKLLCEDYHPHHVVIVTGTSVELLESQISLPKIKDFIVDWPL